MSDTITIPRAEYKRLVEDSARARKLMEDALRESNCDGDLCMYRWHEDFREFLGGKA